MMKIVAALLLLISLEAVTAKECCLCDNCADVAPEKIDMITFSPFEADVVAEEGDEEGVDGATTCGELAFAVLDVEDEEYCALIQEDYQEACCSSEPVELFELEEGYMESLVQGARQLWGSVTRNNNRNRNRNRNRNNGNAARARARARARAAARARARARARNNNANRNRSSSSSSGGGGATACTRSPVGVSFPTPGGNAGFGICRNGGSPRAAAQGATIWDPNERRSFQGNCGYIDRMARQGYMANNMCAITRIRLDGACCSNPTHTSGSLGQSWSASRGGN